MKTEIIYQDYCYRNDAFLHRLKLYSKDTVGSILISTQLLTYLGMVIVNCQHYRTTESMEKRELLCTISHISNFSS